MMELPQPQSQATNSAPPHLAAFSDGPAASAFGRGQRQRRRGGRGGGGRGRSGGRGRGGEHQERSLQLGTSQPIGQDGGQSSADVNGEASNKRINNRRRPRRRGRGGGGGRGNDAADDAVGSRNATTTGSGAAAESTAETPPSPQMEQAATFIAESLARSNGTVSAVNGNAHSSSAPNQPKQRRKKVKKQGADPTNDDAEANSNKQTDAEKKKKKRGGRNRNNRRRPKLQPWRQFIPPGLEDPISLQPLADLPYPPFAIVVDPPYVPVLPEMWPPPPPLEPTAILTSSGDGGVIVGEVLKAPPPPPAVKAPSPPPAVKGKERELAILKEQWGDRGVAVHPSKGEGRQPKTTNDPPPGADNAAATSPADVRDRHLNLFDGRVLAYYLVSTLQFIDPLTRRDLTRPELKALDAYLALHGLGNAGVTEAYDAKGVTVSTASSAAQSASGRAEILQQEARAIMRSFQIGGSSTQQQYQQQQQQQPRREARERRGVRHVQSVGSLREDELEGNSFQRMYAAQEGRRGNHGNNAHPPSHQLALHDTGIYEGDGGGLLLIDDDINPGLRSGMPEPNHNGAAGSAFYSARHIAERHSQEARVREGNFPSLSGAGPALATTDNAVGKKSTPLPPTGAAPKSLSKISKLVKKTDPKDVERQRKAREDAQRRAEMSKLSFFNPDERTQLAAAAGSNPLGVAAPAAKIPLSEAVIERNRNLAMALGVAPSTVRNDVPALTGWARPVTLNEFGSELLDSAAQYPDSLLSEAKERMTELLKLEKQWKKFLSDDRSPGCSLKAMDRPLRKFVHEYSDFWRLKTESFDPEGRRYVHCSKLADTSAPRPLLSEASRRWRGPTAGLGLTVVDMATIPTGPSSRPGPAPSSTAAAAPSSSDGWRTEQRVPLKLVPRTAAVVAEVSIGGGGGAAKPLPSVPASAIGGGMARSTSTPLLSMTNERPPPPRFADLCSKERPRLQLAKRSIPMWDELEKRNISQEEWNNMTPDGQEAILKEVEEEEERKRVWEEREKEKEDARIHRLENRAKKQHALAEKQRAILASAFASDDDGGSSSGSDWFEGDLEFDGSDDEGM